MNRPSNPPATVQKWIFVIDTNAYAGNFERELTAYCTGFIGGCGVGVEQAMMFYADLGLYGASKEESDREEYSPFCDCIEKRGEADDSVPVPRPCDIWPTPGQTVEHNGKTYPAFNSVAIFFKARPSDDLLAIVRTRARMFGAGPHKIRSGSVQFEIVGFRLLCEETTVAEAANWGADA